MECPKCKTPFEEQTIGWSMDEENDYIEISVECEKCHKEFFGRIEREDLILLD